MRKNKNNMYINKCMLYGNLVRDPELKALPSGSAVTNFSIATNRTWKDKEGNKQEDVEFHNIVVFGRQAETVAQYMKKGSAIFVEGRLQTRSWETDGVKKYRTEIVADHTQFGPKSARSEQTDDQRVDEEFDGFDAAEGAGEEINPEDIPF